MDLYKMNKLHRIQKIELKHDVIQPIEG
jgi:hypothetical protein